MAEVLFIFEINKKRLKLLVIYITLHTRKGIKNQIAIIYFFLMIDLI